MIGSKIAEARKQMNISQAQLAEHLFISPQAVGKWERGESIPDLITFNRLAKIVGVDLNYFSEDFPSMVGMKADVSSSNQAATAPAEKTKPSWDMSRGNWVDADFSGLKNLHEKFSASNLQRCKFNGSDLSGLLLRSNHVESCDFSGSNLSASQIQNSHFANDLFEKCLLNDAFISGSHIKGCNFSGADLGGATIKGCDFQKNTITSAVLNRTTFNGTSLSDIVFEGEIEDCYFENCAFSKVIFQNSTLTNTFFKGWKLKGIKFIGCRADRMTYEFLKNGKADLDGIVMTA